MRIADKMTYDQVRNNLLKNRTEMAELQNQAATQKRVTKPSDDPVAAGRVLKSRIDFEGNKQFIKNLNYAKSFLDLTDQSLSEVGESLMRIKELALGQANDASANEESRRVVATEIEQIRNQIINVGNRKLGDRFIFGGFQTQIRPFDQLGQYEGDSGEMMLHIDKATFLPMNISGDKVFLGRGINADGVVRASATQASTIEEFRDQERQAPEIQPLRDGVNVRGPASISVDVSIGGGAGGGPAGPGGVNLFKILEDLEIALRANDKQGVQDSLDVIDAGLSQVVLARAQVGSRAMAVNNLMESQERSKVDNKVAISQHEDADIYATISDINKTEATLQATLQTSGKLIQPSLLDFLR